MQKIDGTTIKLNRGDVLNFTLTLSSSTGDPYTFQEEIRLYSLYIIKTK